VLADILHNIADHTDTLLRVLREPELDSEFVSRLEQHILLEEMENAKRLQSLESESQDPLVKKLVDHNYFIQKLITDSSIPKDLKEELLDHFMEEHQEWQMENPGMHVHDNSTTIAESSNTSHNSDTHNSDTQNTNTHNTNTQSEETSISWTVGPMWQQGGI
jgi:hypothetical protein